MTSDDDLACRDLVEEVTDYLEGDLDPAARLRFEAHLALCDACREYVAQMRATLAAAGTLRPAAVAVPVPPAVLAAFRAWRRN